MKQGDIVILEFPFSDISLKKIRPALVLSNAAYNKHANILLAGIFGKNHPCAVSLKPTDLAKGTMRKASFVSLQNVFSADKSIIRGVIGSLTTTARSRILRQLQVYL